MMRRGSGGDAAALTPKRLRLHSKSPFCGERRVCGRAPMSPHIGPKEQCACRPHGSEGLHREEPPGGANWLAGADFRFRILMVCDIFGLDGLTLSFIWPYFHTDTHIQYIHTLLFRFLYFFTTHTHLAATHSVNMKAACRPWVHNYCWIILW